MIIYNISSYGRINGLVKAVSSVIDQCDIINVALNSYTTIPPELYDNKIRLFITNNEFGDAYKFIELEHSNGYFFTIDDDIVYPKNYTQFMVCNIEKYDRKSIITLHGRKYDKFPIKSFCRDVSEVFHFDAAVDRDIEVEIGGTGVMCFHTELLKTSLSYFSIPNMADLWIARRAREIGAKIVCVKHEGNRLIKQDVGGESIFKKSRHDDTIQTNLINSIYYK